MSTLWIAILLLFVIRDYRRKVCAYYIIQQFRWFTELSVSPHEAGSVGLLNVCALKKVDNSGFLSNTTSVLGLNDAILLILRVSFFVNISNIFGKYTVCKFAICV